MGYLYKIVGIFLVAAAAAAPARADIMDFDCAYVEGAEFLKKAGGSSSKRAACLAGAGFLEEAQSVLRDRASYEEAVLKDVLALLVDGAEPGERLLNIASWNSPEAAFWLLASDHGADLDEKGRNRAVAFFIGAPDWVKTRYAIPFASSLIALNDSANALQTAQALDLAAQGGGHTEAANLANFIRGAVYHDQDATKEAIAFYGKLSAPWDDPLVVEARLRRIALMWSSGALKTADAVVMLEDVDRDWQGDALGARIRLALARAYVFSDKLYESFLVLDRLSHSSAPDEYKKEARQRLKLLALEIFTTRARECSLIAQLDIYNKLGAHDLTRNERIAFDIMSAKWFATSGLHARAAAILDAYDIEIFVAGDAETALTAAETLIEINQRERAKVVSAAVEADSLSQLNAARLRLVQARLARPSAPAPDASPEVAAVNVEEAWRQGLWRVYDRLDLADPSEGFPRKPIAAYLARNARYPAPINETALLGRPILAALAEREPGNIEMAEDLRRLLEDAESVLKLEPLLPVSGAPLSGGDPSNTSISFEQG